MFKIIVILKVICFSPYMQTAIKNGEIAIIYSKDKQYEHFAEITTADGEVFKLPTTYLHYDYGLKRCMGMGLQKDRLGIFYNTKHEIEDFPLCMQGIIHVRFREANTIHFSIGMNAGIYELNMETPNANAILETLKQSEKEQKKVRIYLNKFPKGSSMFYVEFDK